MTMIEPVAPSAQQTATEVEPPSPALRRRHRSLVGAHVAVGVLLTLALVADGFGILFCRALVRSTGGTDETRAALVRVQWISACLAVSLLVLLSTCAVLWAVGRFDVDLQRRVRRLRRAATMLALGLAGWMWSTILLVWTGPGQHRAMAIAAVITTYGLLAVRRSQRYRKVPWGVLLGAFGWGVALMAVCGEMNDAARELLTLAAPLSLSPGTTSNLLAAFAAWDEELAKGIGVVVIFLLCRDRVDDIVSGAAVGAVIGLGFNLVETVQYASPDRGLTDFQLWSRQALGVPLGHATFTALVGAAVGYAVSSPAEPVRRRAAVVATGFALALLGHFAWDALAFSGRFDHYTSTDPHRQLFAVMPLLKLAVNGPFALVLAGAVFVGIRRQRNGMQMELAIEAHSERGAVRWSEAVGLLHPHRRLRARLRALRKGWSCYREVARLQRAQVDLIMWRWRARFAEELGSAHEDRLRERIVRARAEATR